MTSRGMRAAFVVCVGVLTCGLSACSKSAPSGDGGSAAGAGASSLGGAGAQAGLAQGGTSGIVGGGGGIGGDAGTGLTTPNIHCEASLLNGCICVADPTHAFPPDTLQCASSGASYCCADLPGYPSSGACDCEPWTCTANSTECSCGTSNAGTLTTCPTTYTHCCKGAVTKSCSCSNGLSDCAPGDTLVDNCVLDDVECLAGEVRVSACKGIANVGTGGTNGSGGSSFGGGTSTGGGAAGGAAPGITCGDLPFCDGFETGTVGAAADPAKWALTTSAVAPIVDDSQHHGGGKSLKIQDTGNPTTQMLRVSVTPSAIGSTIYGRFYVRFAAAPPSGSPPRKMLSFFDQAPNEMVSLVDWFGGLAWHRSSTDTISPSAVNGLGAPLTASRWYCVELELDEAQGSVNTWLDGAALPVAPLGFSPNPASVNLGWGSPFTGTMLWYDDVAFAAQRIGCCLSNADCGLADPFCNATTHSCSTTPG